jgi:hypothetical protein
MRAIDVANTYSGVSGWVNMVLNRKSLTFIVPR